MSDLIQNIARTYDQLPYLSSAYMQTAPEHLQAVAHVFGLTAPDPSRARVLELGCATGGNLIPFAARHPHARALGIDLSRVQIHTGQGLIQTMQLDNIELRQADIAVLDDELGEFDYILCHGVYSWVPDTVRDATLRLVSNHLAADGIAYISYNTYPGWKTRELIRDAMLLRAATVDDPQDQLRHARAMIECLHDAADEGSLLHKILQDHIQTIRHADDRYLTHEYLELCNAPCYVRDFIAAAGNHELAYLAESDLRTMFADHYQTRAVAPLLHAWANDRPRLEQLFDFLSNRHFRQTLLVRAERAGAIRYTLDASRLTALHIGGMFRPSQSPGPDGEVEEWLSLGERPISTRNRPAQAIVKALNAAWPATVPVASLLDQARQAMGSQGQANALACIEKLAIASAVRMRLAPIRADHRGAARYALPAPLLALVQSGAIPSMPISLFTAWHEAVDKLDDVTLAILPLLDGQHDRQALIDKVTARVAQGSLRWQRCGEPLSPAGVAEEVDASLRHLVRVGLFAVPG